MHSYKTIPLDFHQGEICLLAIVCGLVAARFVVGVVACCVVFSSAFFVVHVAVVVAGIVRAAVAFLLTGCAFFVLVFHDKSLPFGIF